MQSEIRPEPVEDSSPRHSKENSDGIVVAEIDVERHDLIEVQISPPPIGQRLRGRSDHLIG